MPNAEDLLRRLLNEGVVCVDERYKEASDHEGYRAVPLTDEEIVFLKNLMEN